MLLSELARRSGCPASTIHYYRRLGLLPAPAPGPGRGGIYGPLHLERLSRIAELRAARGLTLSQIARELPRAAPPTAPPVAPAARLAAAAAEVLIARGLEGLSVDALADAIGVGKPTLYRHFAGRTALLRACLRDDHVSVPGCVDVDGGRLPPGRWLAARLASVAAHRQRARGVERLCLACWDDPDDALRSAARTSHRRMAERFAAEGLRRLIRSSALPARDPPGATHASRVLWGATLGACDALGDEAADEDARQAWVAPLWLLLGGEVAALERGQDVSAGPRYGWGRR